MIRTQGIGVNKGIGKIGGIIGPLLVENLLTEKLIVIYILLTFFGMLFSYELPMKIGNLSLVQLPENEYDEKKHNKQQSMEEQYRLARIEDQEKQKAYLGKLPSVKEVVDDDVMSVGSSGMSDSEINMKKQIQNIISMKNTKEGNDEDDNDNNDDEQKPMTNLNISKLTGNNNNNEY